MGCGDPNTGVRVRGLWSPSGVVTVYCREDGEPSLSKCDRGSSQFEVGSIERVSLGQLTDREGKIQGKVRDNYKGSQGRVYLMDGRLGREF